MGKKRSYYAVIPADVRYDEKLSSGAKILYGEITALCNEKGFCWASNSYFAELYSVRSKTVSRWVKSLTKAGYISAEVEREKGNQRRIYLSPKMSVPSGQKCPDPMDKNVHTPMDKNVPHNNTILITQSNNTKNNNIDSLSEAALELVLEEKIKQKAAEYELKIQAILPARTKGERSTYSRLRDHLISLILKNQRDVRVFAQVVKWAREARKIEGKHRAIWVAKCKEELGFAGRGKRFLKTKEK